MATVRSARAGRLVECLQAERSGLIRLLQRLVEAESPSHEPATQAAVQGLLSEELTGLGFRVRRRSGRQTGGLLLAVPRRRRRAAPRQLLVGHCDTVWPVGTLAEMPVTLRGGRMTGPGIYDMKGGLALLLYALRALRAAALETPVTPLVLINSDEEIGSPDSRPAVRRLAALADRVLVMEPAMGPRGRLKTTRKGVGQFTVRVRGRAAHAGLEPAKGVSAILELSRLVQRLFELNDPRRGLTVNVGTIEGGMRPNVVAPEARAVVDVRVVSQAQAAEVERALRALEPETRGARLEIDGGFETPPMERTPGNRRLWRLARELGRELDLELEECLAGGASDGNVASLYAPTLDGLGAVGGGAHATHEHVLLDRLVERAALLALLIAAPPIGGRQDPPAPGVEGSG